MGATTSVSRPPLCLLRERFEDKDMTEGCWAAAVIAKLTNMRALREWRIPFRGSDHAAPRANVLIIGGGPAGLALAAELGWRGVSSILIEQGDGVIVTPKMNEVNARSMEHCRRWGIADQVLNCPFPADHPMDAAFVTSLFGYELGRVRRPPRNAQAPQFTSPYNLQACSQHWFDPMLQGLARSFSCVELRYFTRLDSFEQSSDRVTARVTDVKTGQAGVIEADYMVGCDGVSSIVRRGLGIELVGKGTIGHPVHSFFLAPRLLQECGKTLATFFMLVDNGGMWGNLRIIDPAIGLWRLMVDETNGRQTQHTFDREGVLRRALGRPYTVEWLNVSNWHRRSLVATSYGEGRVFLSGDCVHQLSPTGALGMNTGIGDSVDIGWKLAAIFEGWGGDRLLQSYDAERRLVGPAQCRHGNPVLRNQRGGLAFRRRVRSRHRCGSRATRAGRQGVGRAAGARVHDYRLSARLSVRSVADCHSRRRTGPTRHPTRIRPQRAARQSCTAHLVA